jgi:CPA1 family monovalent cation:H+ antiporter
MQDSSLIALIIFVIAGLVALNALSYYAERFKLFPSVIWVLIIGMIYGALNRFGLVDLPGLYLNPDIVLFVLVPILIFSTTKRMCLHDFQMVLKPSILLATAGIVISMICVAMPLHYFFAVPVLEALLFGVIVSATDPIAVSAILDDAQGLSTERKMLIEGESILNDGFVVAVFTTLSVMIFGMDEISLALSGGELVLNIVGAVVLGTALGRLARLLLRVWQNTAPALTVNITLALAFASFLLAETFHLPGVLAVFAGALAFGYRPDKGNEVVQKAQEQVWNYLDYIANSVLFFLLGVSFFSQAPLEIITMMLVVLSVVMLFASRFIALGALSPFVRIDGQRITGQDFWLLNFAGSRGAISIALILLLPNDFSYKPLFLTIAFIMVIVSLVVYPVVLKRVLA